MAWKNVPDTRPRRLPVSATGAALRVGDVHERLVVALGDDRGVVEFVAAHDVAGRADRIVRQQARLAIAEMQPALGKARGMAEQARHRVAHALRVLDALAEHHVAAALAVNRMALRKSSQGRRESARAAASVPACSSG